MNVKALNLKKGTLSLFQDGQGKRPKGGEATFQEDRKVGEAAPLRG